MNSDLEEPYLIFHIFSPLGYPAVFAAWPALIPQVPSPFDRAVLAVQQLQLLHRVHHFCHLFQAGAQLERSRSADLLKFIFLHHFYFSEIHQVAPVACFTQGDLGRAGSDIWRSHGRHCNETDPSHLLE